MVQKDWPWEYLKVDGDLLAKNPAGNYELRLTEELWEVAYVDQIELIAVDHPESVDIFTNEKVGPPTIAKPTVYAFGDADLCPLNRAVDTKGVDVTATLASVDETYVQGFDRRIRQGLCPPHLFELMDNHLNM